MIIISTNVCLEIEKLNKSLAQLHPIPCISGPSCLPGTRTEVLQKICNWTTQNHSQLFWLHGQAGTGKSAVAQSIFNRLQQTNAMRAFYTCSKTSAQLQNPLNVLPTLCFQICAMHEGYAKYIAYQIDNNSSFSESLGHITTQLELLFTKPLQHVLVTFKTRLLIILDALDECGSESEQILLLSALIEVLHACPAMQLLVTSRDGPYLDQQFTKLLHLEYQLNCDNSWSDIDLYWQTHISSIFNGPSIKDHPGLVKTLTHHSRGLFIWSQTVYNYLNISDNPELALDHILQMSSLPEENFVYSHLHKLYYTIIDRATTDDVDNLAIYQCVMGSILLCGEPLSIEVFIQLLSPIISQQAVRKTIKSLMALLYINSDKKIQILHPSFADCILGESSKCTSFHIDVEKIHLILYQQSAHMMLSQLKFNICDLKTSHLRNDQIQGLDQTISLKISQELQYSVQYWIYHLIRSFNLYNVEDDHFLPGLLLDWAIIYWIECLSLLGKLKLGLMSIQQLQVFFKKGQFCHCAHLVPISSIVFRTKGHNHTL